MKQIMQILIVLVTVNSYCQSSVDRTYRLINELLRDIYDNRNVCIDSVPCNNYFEIDGSYLQDCLELINSNLSEKEITFFLDVCDSSRCFLPVNRLELTIKSCDSTSIHITEIDNKINVRKFVTVGINKWRESKIFVKCKRRKCCNIALSEPIVNDDETIMLIHIVNYGESDLRGETILLKKLNNKWTRICTLFSWIT